MNYEASMFYTFWTEYLTVAKFAEDFNLTEQEARDIIDIGRDEYNAYCEKEQRK